MDLLHAKQRATIVRSFAAVRNLHLVRVAKGISLEKALGDYSKDPAVLYAEPDYTVHALQNPAGTNDPRFAELWGLQNAPTGVNAPRAWGLSTGGPNVVVGVIDTGIDYNHEDLSANVFRNPLDCNNNGIDDDANGFIDDCYGIDTANGDSDPMDDHGHGTHVAGTIGAAGNNGIGVVGLNWQVKLLVCKFLDASGGGYTSGAIGCLDYIASMKDRGVNVVATNNSWGGGQFSQALLDAIDSHRQRGILFIASAGNSGGSTDVHPQYPSNFDLPNIIAVASTTSWDTLSSFSNYGRYSVHVAAPGTDILSTTPGNTYSLFSGTSMAAPHVTGVAALLAAQDPTRDWKAIKNLILAGGDTKTFLAETISQRRLSAYGALTCSNSIVRARMLPRDDNLYLTVAEPLILAALNINCARPNGNFSVLVDGGAETITLLDDGQGTDQEANDGIYSGQHAWSLAEVGAHTLTFSTGDVVTVNVIPALSPYTYSTAVPFNYRSITGSQVPHMGAFSDLQLAQITPPFPIRFGDVNFSSLYVAGPGYVIFRPPLVTSYSNVPLPTPKTRTMVAPFWDWLEPNANVYWDVIGAAPNRELVIEWRGVDHTYSAPWYGACGSVPPSGITFEIVFFEGSSDILFNYLDVTFGPYTPNVPENCDVNTVPIDQGVSATVGVQVEPGLATQFSFNTPSLTENSSILWKIGRPAPAVTDLAPFTASAGGPAFKLRVTGAGFLDGSLVRWNGSDRATTFVNSGELSASISDTDIASAATVPVTVLNSPPNGEGESAPATFTVYSAYPTPMLIGVTPDSMIAGADQVFTLTGTNFVSASVARWNGSDRPTKVFSSTQMEFSVYVADTGMGGVIPVTVFTPVPGGGTSNKLTVNVTNPAPALGFASPVNIGAGGSGFTLQVWGSGFTPASVVRWNGSDRSTVLDPIDTYSLKAAIPATDIASPGTAQVTVFNPAPGGGTSNSMTFDIVTPPANDNFANATVISSYPFTQTEDTRGAGTEATDPTSNCTYPFKTVWYRFTPPAAGAVVTVDTAGSNYGTVLSAWTGSPGSFTQLGCTYDIRLRVVASGTAPIYFMLTNLADYDPAGILVFNLNMNVPAPAVTLSPSSLTFAPQIIDTTSATQTVTLTNSGAAPLTISRVSLSLFGAGSFGATKNCIDSFNPGESCKIEVWTHALGRGSYAGAVVIEDNAFGSPHFIPLSGIGTDFSISPSSGAPTSVTVDAGQTATYSLSLAGTFEFSGSVELSCVGAPTAASCNLTPLALSVNGTIPVAATVNITTTARAALPPLGGPSNVGPRVIPILMVILFVLVALLTLGQGLRTRRLALRTPAFALVMIIGLLLLISCGGGGSSSFQPPPPPPPPALAGTPAGTYTIKVTATSGGVSRDISLTLAVR